MYITIIFNIKGGKVMGFNIARKEGEMCFSPLNETSDKVMMDALVVFKPDDYCPLFDDDFEPQKSSPFLGEVSSRPYRVDEVTICEDYFSDQFEKKLYELTNGEEPTRAIEREAAFEVLDESNYTFSIVYGKATGKLQENGSPEIHYSLRGEEGSKPFGFALLDAYSSSDIAQMFIDRVNGKDVKLHAINVYPSDKVPSEYPFTPTDNDEIRDNQIFGFLDNKGVFVPESELNHNFQLAKAADMTEQAKAGKDFDHLPKEARTSLPLSKIVIANNPNDLEKTNLIISTNLLDGIVARMALREPDEKLKEDSLKLLNSLEKVAPKFIPVTAANLIRHNCITCKDLPERLRNNHEIYASLIAKNADLLNVGASGGAKLEDIPTHILQSPEIANLIADQMVFKSYFTKPQDIVFFEALPDELQKNPIILGREFSQNSALLPQLGPQSKENPDFLNSLFKTLGKEQFPEIFSQLYGGVKNAPRQAKEAAISTIRLSQEEVRPVLDATFGKQEVDKMIAKGQKVEFGKERGFAPNLTGGGYKHLSAADITMNATGEIKSLKMFFDNGYVEPDGDHGGWHSQRSHIIDSFENPILIQAPLHGCENIKKEIGLALGGAEAPKAWMPAQKSTGMNKDVYRHLPSDDKSVRG